MTSIDGKHWTNRAVLYVAPGLMPAGFAAGGIALVMTV